MELLTAEPVVRAPEVSATLLGIIEKLARDLHPSRAAFLTVRLDSSLENDLGFDSLGRAEIGMRIEQNFGVVLPDSSIASAETPADLLAALSRSSVDASALLKSQLKNRVERPAYEKAVPEMAATLVEVLKWHADRHPAQKYLEFLLPDSEETQSLSFGTLYKHAREYAAHLAEKGLQFSEPVAIMLPTSLEFFYSFFGAIMAGGVPVPLYPPDRPSQLAEYLARQHKIIENSQARFLISTHGKTRTVPLVQGALATRVEILFVEDFVAGLQDHVLPLLKTEQAAFIQYTSGSTGDPKGVVLSHANLLANIRAMGSVLKADASDIFVSWLPLYHDMGLIGAFLGTLYFGSMLVLMSPLTFLARPARWLWLLHKYKGTISAAPNFAFELCATRVQDAELVGLDLSSWRLALNGAEAVRPATLKKFISRFSRYGFKAEAMMGVYGLAESSVGLSFPKIGKLPKIEVVDHQAMVHAGVARLAANDSQKTLSFVSCGVVLPGHRVRIADDQDHTLPEALIGHIQFQGPSCTAGYYRNDEASARLFHKIKDPGYLGTWLDSGDLGYSRNGELFVTGRLKDMIIRGGEHYFPEELEEKLGSIPGVRRGCVVVFGSVDPQLGTERVVIAAEARTRDLHEQSALRSQLEQSASALLGITVDVVRILPPRSIPKTPSGKLQRSKCRQLFESGELGAQHSRVWQSIYLAEKFFKTRVQHVLGLLGSWGYGSYVWFLAVAIAPWWLLTLTLLPDWNLRMSCSRVLGKIFFSCARIKIQVAGLENLESVGPKAILVSNHTSYLDVMALVTALPKVGHFVAKKEFERHWLARSLFKRLGCYFVERTQVQEAMEDVKLLSGALERNETLYIFSEGGFSREPGVKPFRMGAFTLAAQQRCPVVGISLQGVRLILPDQTWRPRRGNIRIVIHKARRADSDRFDSVVKLKRLVRQDILADSGEGEIPD